MLGIEAAQKNLVCDSVALWPRNVDARRRREQFASARARHGDENLSLNNNIANASRRRASAATNNHL